MTDTPLPTGLAEQTCVRAFCARCLTPYEDSEGSPFYFADAETAAAYLAQAGWRVSGAVTCAECVCAETGHHWDDWRGGLAWDEAGRQWRQCRCGKFEVRDIAGGAA